ncbi:MAG TPA: hypothetical protein VMZ91_13380 [Candidatus Paceibacterota bacterium]|nr:hypothetical protein [Candidatus Paceibacterota bacterium]
MTKSKLIGSTYVNIVKDENGEVKFAYGYEIDDKELSLNDFAMLNSFLDKVKAIAEQDFNDRLDINEKEFSIESKEDD